MSDVFEGAMGRGAGRRVAAALAALLVLAGCASDGELTATSTVGQFLRGTTAEPTTIDPELITPTIGCPTITINPGTEALRREDGSGGADALRWQASIVRTARECTLIGEGEGEGEGEGASVAVRVGVSGRVIEGSRGAPEVVELPLRIAVREGGEVTYSRLHNVRVALEGVSQPWAFVDENVRVSSPEAEIIVGFDG